MPKYQRRRLLNSSSADKYKSKADTNEGEVWSARGRLQGALQEVLEPPAPPSDHDTDQDSRESTDSGCRQPYVLKLFDRSVDLAQFSENSPLYPVCRAWILNTPRSIYTHAREEEENQRGCGGEREGEGGVRLPPPSPPPADAPRLPPLLGEQRAASREALDACVGGGGGGTARDRLLHAHVQRWGAVREAWLRHARAQHAPHARAQAALNMLHVTM